MPDSAIRLSPIASRLVPYAVECEGHKLKKAQEFARVGACLKKFVHGFSHVLWSHGNAGDGMNLHPLRVIRVLNVGSHDADVRAHGW